MKTVERSRNYAVITYHPLETVDKVLKGYFANGRLRHYAYIVHDKDTDDEGKIKTSHIHILLQLNNAMTLTAVRALFPDGANTLGQVVYDKSSCFAYLTHKDNPNKYQYDDSVVVSDALEYWQGLQRGDNTENMAMCIVDDLIKKVDFRTMVSRYGRDFVIYHQRYMEIANQIIHEECEKKYREKRKQDEEREKMNGEKRIQSANSFTLIDEETGEVVNPFAPTKQIKMHL